MPSITVSPYVTDHTLLCRLPFTCSGSECRIHTQSEHRAAAAAAAARSGAIFVPRSARDRPTGGIVDRGVAAAADQSVLRGAA